MRLFLLNPSHYYPQLDVSGWFASDAIRGIHCFWDGGISRGAPVKQVPWANIIDPRTNLYWPGLPETSTGLWTELGAPVLAPDSFLNRLPVAPLDGILTCPTFSEDWKNRLLLAEGVDWSEITYIVHASPPLERLLSDGLIQMDLFMRTINERESFRWLSEQTIFSCGEFMSLGKGAVFGDELIFLNNSLDHQSDVYLNKQTKLSNDQHRASFELDELMKIEAPNKYGVMLRSVYSTWMPYTTDGFLVRYA